MVCDPCLCLAPDIPSSGYTTRCPGGKERSLPPSGMERAPGADYCVFGTDTGLGNSFLGGLPILTMCQMVKLDLQPPLVFFFTG